MYSSSPLAGESIGKTKKVGKHLKKIYVVDTNVLIQAPYAIHCFEDNNVVIPLVVIEELDGLKKAEGERGANARTVIRSLETLRTQGDLLEGVALDEGGMLWVEKNFIREKLPPDLPEDKSDNRILMACAGLARTRIEQVVLVTKDLVLRVKAQIMGLKAEDFTTEQITSDDAAYTGREECYIPSGQISRFQKNKTGIPLTELYTVDDAGNQQSPSFVENEFVIMTSDRSSKSTVLGRVCNGRVVPLIFSNSHPYGVSPRNVGQIFLQEALMQPSEAAPLVIVKGMAGTAKTFYSLAVGLHKVYNASLEEREYRRIMICRPNAQFDDDIGFLPGNEQEKIAPLMRPVIDNLEQLLDSDEKHRYDNEGQLSDKVSEVFARGIIQEEALNFIRGRSIVQTYLIIDEAQNLTPNQVKGIITRAGKGTKIVLLGDPNQIDKPFLDERTNGLSYAAKCMKGSPLCWQITMSAEECERSALAMDAIQRM